MCQCQFRSSDVQMFRIRFSINGTIPRFAVKLLFVSMRTWICMALRDKRKREEGPCRRVSNTLKLTTVKDSFVIRYLLLRSFELLRFYA